MNKSVIYVAILKYGCRIEKRCETIRAAAEFQQSLKDQGFEIHADRFYPVALEAKLNLH